MIGDPQQCANCGFLGEIDQWHVGFVPWTIVCPQCGELHDESSPAGGGG